MIARSRHCPSVVVLLALCIFASPPLAASGSYRGRPQTGRVDAARYHLGKQIYTGEVDASKTQAALLAAIEKEVPAGDRGERSGLAALAGTLSAREIHALRFHVATRYGLAGLDRDLYERGGRVLAGDLEGQTQTEVSAELQAARQKRLEALQALLPDEEKSRLDVRDLSRRATPEALEALEYHAAVRFKQPAVDQASYDLGARILQGGRDEEQLGHLAAEERVLASLESRLPAPRKPERLTSLAGRLTPEQLDALEYYLRVRYRLK